MRLEQKYFVPFMLLMGAISMVFIVISSFSFNANRQQRFKDNITASESLLTTKMRVIGLEDSISVQLQAGEPTVLLFWASWSEKSTQMMEEIERYRNNGNHSLSVIAALVKDAEESLPEVQHFPEFIYTDGVGLFNDLKVPGYPSFILFDEQGAVLYTQIGFQKGVAYDILNTHLE